MDMQISVYSYFRLKGRGAGGKHSLSRHAKLLEAAVHVRESVTDLSEKYP